MEVFNSCRELYRRCWRLKLVLHALLHQSYGIRRAMTVSHMGENGSPGRRSGLTTGGFGGLAEKEARPHGFVLPLHTLSDWSTLLVIHLPQVPISPELSSSRHLCPDDLDSPSRHNSFSICSQTTGALPRPKPGPSPVTPGLGGSLALWSLQLRVFPAQPGNITLISWLRALSLWRQNCCFPPCESSEPKLHFSLLTWLNHKTTGRENATGAARVLSFGKVAEENWLFRGCPSTMKVSPGLKTDPDFPWNHLWSTEVQEFFFFYWLKCSLEFTVSVVPQSAVLSQDSHMWSARCPGEWNQEEARTGTLDCSPTICGLLVGQHRMFSRPRTLKLGLSLVRHFPISFFFSFFSPHGMGRNYQVRKKHQEHLYALSLTVIYL